MNIRTLAVVGACVAMIAGVVATNQWRELRAERALTAELRTRIGGQIDQTPAPLWTPGVDAGASVASQNSTDASLVTIVPPNGAAATGPGTDDHDLLLHPHHREARRTELRTIIEQGYPGLVEELALTQLESEQFFGLLAEGRVAMEAEAYIFEREPVDLLAAAQATRNRQARQRQQNEAVKALLGDDRNARWLAYQQNQTAWMQARAYGNALATSGAPLDGARTRVIALAMIEERQSQRQDIAALARAVDPADPQALAQARAAQQGRRNESSQRVLDAVAPHLSELQLHLLRDQIALQDAADRAAAR